MAKILSRFCGNNIYKFYPQDGGEKASIDVEHNHVTVTLCIITTAVGVKNGCFILVPAHPSCPG